MNRNCAFFHQIPSRQFTDLTNYNSTSSNRDTAKHSLRTSFVGEYETSSKRSKSKQPAGLKGFSKYQKSQRTSDSAFNSSYQRILTDKSSAHQYTSNNNSSNNLLKPEASFTKPSELSGFSRPSSRQPGYSLSIKVPREIVPLQSQQLRNNIQQRQNVKLISHRQSQVVNQPKVHQTSKQKLNFRQSLGTLSKQIKNTLKTTINNNFSDHNTSTTEKIRNQSQIIKAPQSNQNTRSGYQNDEIDPTYKRYEKSSSFILNAQIGRLKKPKRLDIQKQDYLGSIKVENKENILYEPKPTGISSLGTSRYQSSKSDFEKNPLGKSSVISSFSSNEKFLKFSSVIEPLTPQLRNMRKYDSYNAQKERKNVSTYESYKPNLTNSYISSSYKPDPLSYKLDLTSSYTNTPKTASTKFPTTTQRSTFLQYSSVLDNNRDRDSLSSKQRSSLGKQLSLNDFHLGSVKGEGRFGKFYPAIHKKTGMLVGIKQIKKESLKHMLDQFIQQLKIQSYLDHPNIVKLYGYFAEKQNFYLVMEYMEQGSLFSFIKKSKKLTEQETSTKLKQICSAVEYLHENQVLHRDIKPQNIVMTCDVCKLCDFGWAVYSSSRRRTYCGTLDYVCPQILQGDSYDTCVDIWAIGVLAFQMIVGKAPFYNISRKQTMKNIMQCNFQIPKQLSIKAKQFISKALNKDPNERQSVARLAKHEFLN